MQKYYFVLLIKEKQRPLEYIFIVKKKQTYEELPTLNLGLVCIVQYCQRQQCENLQDSNSSGCCSAHPGGDTAGTSLSQ